MSNAQKIIKAALEARTVADAEALQRLIEKDVGGKIRTTHSVTVGTTSA